MKKLKVRGTVLTLLTLTTCYKMRTVETSLPSEKKDSRMLLGYIRNSNLTHYTPSDNTQDTEQDECREERQHRQPSSFGGHEERTLSKLVSVGKSTS